MEDAKVEIDDGKEYSVVPDTMYQYVLHLGLQTVPAYEETYFTVVTTTLLLLLQDCQEDDYTLCYVFWVSVSALVLRY